MTLLQPFERIEVKESVPVSNLDAEAELMPGRLQGKIATHILTEEFWHAHAVNYISLGMSVIDTAKACNVTGDEVRKLVQAPWFQERVAKKIDDTQGDIKAILQPAALDAALVLVEIMKNSKSSNRDRIVCAKEIIERMHGKSTQFVEVKAQNQHVSPVETVAALENELKVLRKDIRIEENSERSELRSTQSSSLPQSSLLSA